jgi:glycosyltransferase involved in cell wall biosynthesis
MVRKTPTANFKRQKKTDILFTKFPLESHYGGGEYHTIKLAEALTARGHRVVLLSSDPILLRVWKERKWSYHKLTIGQEPTSKKSVITFTLHWRKISEQLREAWSELSQQYNFGAVYMQSLNGKLLLTPHIMADNIPIFWIEHLQIEKWLTQNPWRFYYCRLAKQVTVITVSQGVRKQLEQLGVPPSSVRVIYNGVELPEVNPVYQAHKPFTIGTVARLAVEKDIGTVIKAVALLEQQGIKLQYKIAGEGDQEAILRNLINQHKLHRSVHLVGFLQDLKDYYRSLDVFVLTSVRRESFGIAVAEAAAFGKPAIVSNTIGLNEVVIDKETGFLVPPNNPSAVAEKIKAFIDQPALVQKMGTKAHQRVAQRFTLPKMIDKFEKVMLLSLAFMIVSLNLFIFYLQPLERPRRKRFDMAAAIPANEQIMPATVG